MDNHSIQKPLMACRESSRQAMSLLEMIAVITILGMLSITGISHYGHNSLLKGNAEGFARKIVLSLTHARRSTIATGDNHYLEMTSSGGSVTSFALFRKEASADTQTDQTWEVPDGLTVTASASRLEFDFEGAALASYTVTIKKTTNPDNLWTISVTTLTGHAKMTLSTL